MSHRRLHYTAACSHSGCQNDYFPDKWGKIEALNKGWFFQRNGDAWCPDHTPDWVAEWRRKRDEKSE